MGSVIRLNQEAHFAVASASTEGARRFFVFHLLASELLMNECIQLRLLILFRYFIL